MKAFLLNTGLVILIIILIGIPLEMVINRFSGTFSKQDWILSRTGEQYDYAFIGSSRVFNVLDIPAMREEYDAKMINLGTSGSNYAESYVLLSEFLKRNNIRTLVINVDEFSLNSDLAFSHSFHDYNMLPLYAHDEHRPVFNDFLPPWKAKLWSILPISRYIEYNSRLTWLEHPQKKLTTLGGYQPISDKEAAFKKSRQVLSVDTVDLAYLVKIIEIGKENGLNIIFITTPLYVDIVKVKLNREEAYQAISELARKYEIPYIPAGEIFEEKDAGLFRDYTHTTRDGSKIYSRNLARKLANMDS